MRTPSYLELAEKHQVDANFWLSREYFQKAGLKQFWFDDLCLVKDGDTVVFPPLSAGFAAEVWDREMAAEVWSDFAMSLFRITPAETYGIYRWRPKFLDFEYIYDPRQFVEMKGGKLKTFRKNCRKFPKRYPKGVMAFSYEDIRELEKMIGYRKLCEELENMFLLWMDGKNAEDIQDADVMMEYLWHGENRKGLWDEFGNLLAVNIWDENYKYVNYRYCICGRENFLSEYIRWRFYTDPLILEKGKLVNDGGVLDNPNLEFFKDKMNPIRKRPVYTWVYSGKEEG